MAATAALPLPQLHATLKLFQDRADSLGAALRPMLIEASLPLARRLRVVGQGLMDIHGTLAAGYLRIADETPAAPQAEAKSWLAALCTATLHNLALQYQASLFISTQHPAGLWDRVFAVARLLATAFPSDMTRPPDTIAADLILKGILALAAIQPEGLTAREITFIGDYLGKHTGIVEIQLSLPEHLADWHWLQEGLDSPPVAAARRLPPEGKELLFYSCAALGKRVRERLDQRKESTSLPDTALLSPDDQYNVLARAALRWNTPAKRQFHRRRNNYRVQVCTQLSALWKLLRGDLADTGHSGMPISDWMVLNESAGGYAIMHVAGDVAGLVAGSVLGLRTGPAPWSVCVARWARSDNPEHVELGLELIAPTAEAVRIAQPHRRDAPAPELALLLPPLPRLDRTEALLTKHGQYLGGSFTLIGESNGKLQVTGCVAGRLAMQTANVDVFEFERDFSPL